MWLRVELTSDGIYLPAGFETGPEYRPLLDGRQAMELVRRFRLRIEGSYPLGEQEWVVWQGGNRIEARNADLNRAIVECVAKMHLAMQSGGTALEAAGGRRA